MRLKLFIKIFVFSLFFSNTALATIIYNKRILSSSRPQALFEDPSWQEPFQAAYQQLFDNLQVPEKGPRFAFPGPLFPGIYLWDSAFIAFIWADWDLRTAEDVLRAVFVNQAADGRIPHAVKGKEVKDTTQPPVLSWAVYEIYKTHKNISFVKEVLPDLKRFHSWLLKERRHANGLFFWQNAYESSVDNSARFTNQAQTVEGDTKALEAIDLSAFVVLDAEALANLCRLVGDDKSAEQYQKYAEDLKAKINELLWDSNDGLYYDRNSKTKAFHKFNTLASFVPLVAGIADQKQAARLLKHLKNKNEYNTLIPLPNVALNDPHFQRDCWRGPVWVNMSYLTLKGMRRYGYEAEYKDFRKRLINGIYQVWNKEKDFYEFYDPTSFSTKNLTRKIGNERTNKKLGTTPVPNFVGWTGLVNTLAIEIQREGL